MTKLTYAKNFFWCAVVLATATLLSAPPAAAAVLDAPRGPSPTSWERTKAVLKSYGNDRALRSKLWDKKITLGTSADQVLTLTHRGLELESRGGFYTKPAHFSKFSIGGEKIEPSIWEKIVTPESIKNAFDKQIAHPADQNRQPVIFGPGGLEKALHNAIPAFIRPGPGSDG